VAALEDVKAQDIQVIDVRDKQSITDFMIIATGTSNRQINAMLDKVREEVKAQGVKPLGEEGKGDSDWVLLDLDDVIVHMMTAAHVSSTTWSACGPVPSKPCGTPSTTARKTPTSISPSSTKTRNKGCCATATDRRRFTHAQVGGRRLA
jgi:ribosome silencing factor RsfS/YbeB/iojap